MDANVELHKALKMLKDELQVSQSLLFTGSPAMDFIEEGSSTGEVIELLWKHGYAPYFSQRYRGAHS